MIKSNFRGKLESFSPKCLYIAWQDLTRRDGGVFVCKADDLQKPVRVNVRGTFFVFLTLKRNVRGTFIVFLFIWFYTN